MTTAGEKEATTYQVEDGNFHHALIEIGRPVLDNLDSHHLLCLEVLALDDLAKCALPKNVEDEVTIPIVGSVSEPSKQDGSGGQRTCGQLLLTPEYH